MNPGQQHANTQTQIRTLQLMENVVRELDPAQLVPPGGVTGLHSCVRSIVGTERSERWRVFDLSGG